MSKESYDNLYKDWSFENQTYTKVSKKEEYVLRELFRRVELPPNATVLDIGCGLGWKSNLISQMGYNVTGVDISDVAITKAKELWGIKGIDFRVCDMSAKDALNKKFDIIFASSFSLFKYDFRNGDNYYGKVVFSYLKPGGYLIFDWASNSKWKAKHLDWAYISVQDARKYFSPFGEIVGIWAGYRELFPVLRKLALLKIMTKAIIFLSHFHHVGYRLYCIVQKSSGN